MRNINGQMKTMWKYCKPEKFNEFRTFILGIQGQSMFPNGVIYKGVDAQPRFYRGPSGANDCIMPTIDHLLEITSMVPENDSHS
jgi:indoleamine 2,3-dioxygenase